jgi:cell division control protein 24
MFASLSTVRGYSDIPANANSDSDLRTAEHQQELSENVAVLLETNQSLSRRLMNLEDAFEVRTSSLNDRAGLSALPTIPMTISQSRAN